jgi:UDP-glucuronate 4-epimerase
MSNGEQITLYGDGSSRRDYTYIDDIIDGVMAAIDYKDSMYEIINLGNNRTVQLLELPKTTNDSPPTTVPSSVIRHRIDRPGRM